MKKIVLFAAALVATTVVNAQTGEITSNRGENWLSQDGDWGLTFDAQPLLNYAGNLFNGATSNTNTVQLNNLWSSPNGSTVVIAGKKLVDANTAYRGRLRIGFGSTKETFFVDQAPQPSPPPTPFATVEDVEKTGFMAINLGAGIEKRVGSSRIVGVYGGEVNIGFGNSKTSYEYGNAISADNQVLSRPTEEKQGSTIGIGLNAFAGVEWFCAPKLSLSGEYTWGLALTSTGAGESTNEGWNGTAVVSTTVEGTANDGIADKSSNFGIDTGVSGARIGLNFYFQ